MKESGLAPNTIYCASVFSFYEMKLLNVAQERLKVIILLLSSTGMRIGALPSLKLKHLTKIQEYGLYQLIIYENTKSEHVAFCTPESAAMLDS